MSENNEQDGFEDELKELIFSGQKIAAIKLYREKTGLGLKEAKDAVDAMERELREEQADQFVAKTGGGGCGMVLLLGFMSVGALASYLIA